MSRITAILMVISIILLISGATSFCYAQYGGGSHGGESGGTTLPPGSGRGSHGPGLYIPAKPDTSEIVPADTVVARYFQYLNVKSFDYSYDTFSKEFRGKYSYDSYLDSLDKGILYEVKRMSPNKKDDSRAEVNATILARGADGSNPRYMECTFSLIKEDRRWKISDYDCRNHHTVSGLNR
jgi:hypothetical protein